MCFPRRMLQRRPFEHNSAAKLRIFFDICKYSGKKIKKEPLSRLSTRSVGTLHGSLAVVGCVVLISTDFPEVSLHGLFATGSVLLCREVLLVRGDLVEIALTSLHSSSHSGEACTSIQLVGRQRGRTLLFMRNSFPIVSGRFNSPRLTTMLKRMRFG